MTYPYPQQKDKSGVVPIVVGIVILVAIVAAAAAFFLLGRGGEKTEQTAQQEFKPVESTTTSTASTTSAAPSTKESPSPSVVTVTETASNPEEHYDHGRDKSTVSGGILSDRGWSGSYASCTAGEDLILAGTSDDGKVVVCGNAGGATYPPICSAAPWSCPPKVTKAPTRLMPILRPSWSMPMVCASTKTTRP